VSSSAADLLEHLKQETIKREQKDQAIAQALCKIADSSASTREAMKTMAQAMLELVAKQSHKE
jgi:hypothetical protein